jgi:hypothetical protein
MPAPFFYPAPDEDGMRLFLFLLALAWVPWMVPGVSRAGGLSGKIAAEAGGLQGPQGDWMPYAYGGLWLEDRSDLSSGFSLEASAEADGQFSDSHALSTWPPGTPSNEVSTDSSAGFSSGKGGSYLLRLDRVFLVWAQGRLEARAGLFHPSWGSDVFFKPTDYFNPPALFQWGGEVLPGSEGADAVFFLFDDLSLEGAVRWVQGGASEEVLRLVNRGIGFAVTPSFSRMTDRTGLGMEAVGTFPTFQLRLEGVDWLYRSGGSAAAWNLGLTTLLEGEKFDLEMLRGPEGDLQGEPSERGAPRSFLFISTEREFGGQWKAHPVLAAPLEGGPLLFWPRLSWAFSGPWELGFQAQWPLEGGGGPLAVPSREGLSVSYSF